jgi:hypothetical protein
LIRRGHYIQEHSKTGRLAQRSVAMAIFPGKQWLNQRDKQQIGGDPALPPVGLEHSAEEGLKALLLAAKAANKQAKDEEHSNK